MSGANERADVKSTIPKYLIGVALVVMCSLIASAVANIANTSGGNDASGIVNKGFELGGIKVGTVTPPDSEPGYTPPDIPPRTIVYDVTESGVFGYADLYNATKFEYLRDRNDATRKIGRVYYGADGKIIGRDTYNLDSKERITKIEHMDANNNLIGNSTVSYETVGIGQKVKINNDYDNTQKVVYYKGNTDTVALVQIFKTTNGKTEKIAEELYDEEFKYYTNVNP